MNCSLMGMENDRVMLLISNFVSKVKAKSSRDGSSSALAHLMFRK